MDNRNLEREAERVSGIIDSLIQEINDLENILASKESIISDYEKEIERLDKELEDKQEQIDLHLKLFQDNDPSWTHKKQKH